MLAFAWVKSRVNITHVQVNVVHMNVLCSLDFTQAEAGEAYLYSTSRFGKYRGTYQYWSKKCTCANIFLHHIMISLTVSFDSFVVFVNKLLWSDNIFHAWYIYFVMRYVSPWKTATYLSTPMILFFKLICSLILFHRTLIRFKKSSMHGIFELSIITTLYLSF